MSRSQRTDCCEDCACWWKQVTAMHKQEHGIKNFLQAMWVQYSRHCRDASLCFVYHWNMYLCLVVYPCDFLKTCFALMHTHNHFTALWVLSGNTWVSWYQKKHLPTHSCCGHQSSLICFLHLLRSMASSLFSLCAWQSFSTISLQVFFGLPLGLALSTSYSIHFFTQTLSSFRSTCPYYCNS